MKEKCWFCKKELLCKFKVSDGKWEWIMCSDCFNYFKYLKKKYPKAPIKVLISKLAEKKIPKKLLAKRVNYLHKEEKKKDNYNLDVWLR